MNRIKVGPGALVVATAILIGYGLGRAGASGIPQTGALVYSGTLLTFGQPDNGSHLIGLTLFQSNGTQTTCVISATSIQVTNGQFSVPLPSSCVTTIHTYSALDVQVNIDGTPMAMQPLSAVPYAIEADTATEMVTDTSGGTTCSGLAGHMRWTGSQFQGCNGTNWIVLQGSVGTSGNPGASCMDILNRGGSSGSGLYYIDPVGQSGGTSAPFQAYCDMTDNGGGYTLVLRDALIDGTIIAASALTWPTTAEGNITTGGDYLISLAALQALGKSGSTYDYLGFATGTDATLGQYLRCTQTNPITTNGPPTGTCAYQDGSTNSNAEFGISFHPSGNCQNVSWWASGLNPGSWWGGSMFCDPGTCASCVSGGNGGWPTTFPNALGTGAFSGIPRASNYVTWVLSR